jgi:predicted membrane GTPase involved in stress response
MFFRAIQLGIDKILLFGAQMFSFLKNDKDENRGRLRELFDSTSDQVREKAESTKKAVKLRMAVLEIEHHLNRLYPQIGKITCDLADEGVHTILQNEDLKTRIELASEYRERLKELRSEQEVHYTQEKKEA